MVTAGNASIHSGSGWGHLFIDRSDNTKVEFSHLRLLCPRSITITIISHPPFSFVPDIAPLLHFAYLRNRIRVCISKILLHSGRIFGARYENVCKYSYSDSGIISPVYINIIIFDRVYRLFIYSTCQLFLKLKFR